MASKLRVVLADDHALMRSGLRALLANLDGVEVVGEARDGQEAIEQVAALAPDVVLMDISMPSLNGIEATARIIKKFPKVRVVILSMYDNEDFVLRTLRAGASGFMIKDSAAQELAVAVFAAVRGEKYLSPSVSKGVIDGFLKCRITQASPFEQLTRRQREVLQLIAEGRNAREISTRLNISMKTVESHRAQLMQRLGIHDIPGLVRYAICVGLVASAT